MHEDKSERPVTSNEKRDPGFARIRKGLLAHLPGMSGNAVKLYLLLHFKACWFGPKRGWVEASFDDMARWCGWSTKTLQRTVEKLEAKPYIEVERAANQHELSRIKILKYDLEESTSAVDKSDQSSTVGVDSAVDCAVDSAVDKIVHSKAASALSQQDLRASKKVVEVKKEKNGEADAVRRPFDAERLATHRKSFSPSERRKKLEERLAATIARDDESLASYLARNEKRYRRRYPDDWDSIRMAFDAVGYSLDEKNPLLSITFVWEVRDIWEKFQGKDISPGILCTKVIDAMMHLANMDDECYPYPPDFVEHRDRLRAQERIQERSNAGIGVRA